MVKTTFCAKNWSKTTPCFWERIGNTLMYIGLPSVTSVIMGSPLSSEAKLWVNFIITIIFLVGKGLTKFFAEEQIK